MENDRLLKKYKIKLSVYFALFVMFFLYVIQILFVWIQFVTANLDLKNTLEQKWQAIENILKNKQLYSLEISQDETLQKLILKTLDKSIILLDGKKIIDFSNSELSIPTHAWVTNYNKKKYNVSDVREGELKYTIIVWAENSYNLEVFLKQIGLYLLILSPFFIFFYFLGYTFVGKNFRVIEQSIHSLEDFTSQVNHEMKTPLSELISTLSLAKKIHNYEEAVDISLNSAFKLTKILESIIGMAHLSDISYRKERLDLGEILDDILTEYKSEISEKKLIIEKNISTPKILKANKEHLYLCIKNIISNAIKYSQNGWKIEISFSHGVLSIQDYGVGIDKWNLAKIFQRYFRESYTSHEWFGLGLALVKKIVDINHWELQVESLKDTFTKITIKFQ